MSFGCVSCAWKAAQNLTHEHKVPTSEPAERESRLGGKTEEARRLDSRRWPGLRQKKTAAAERFNHCCYSGQTPMR